MRRLSYVVCAIVQSVQPEVRAAVLLVQTRCLRNRGRVALKGRIRVLTHDGALAPGMKVSKREKSEKAHPTRFS